MFGFVIAGASSLDEDEKTRYRALYCGLCRSLEERYGQASRATLSYDLTFYIVLCNSLHEPAETVGERTCLMHPRKKMPFARSGFTDYAADLAVALAYHKCLDDWNDDRSPAALAARIALMGAYAKARANVPAQCAAVEAAMHEITRIERASDDAGPDAAARVFGRLLGELFAHDQGAWADQLRCFGEQLGRFIYLMDAAVDYADDERTGSYNPLVRQGWTPANMKTLLSVLIGGAAAAFEKLPLEQDLHLMRSVLYSGVWQQFNKTYGEREGEVQDAPTADGQHD